MIPYFLAPFIGWTVSGCLKFAINRVRHGDDARGLMGYGGFPSTHTTTIATVVVLIGFREGWFSAVFGLGIAFLFITIIDATNLRIAVGKQAATINTLTDSEVKLRERMGHTRIEILGGLVVGFITGLVIHMLSTFIGGA